MWIKNNIQTFAICLRKYDTITKFILLKISVCGKFYRFFWSFFMFFGHNFFIPKILEISLFNTQGYFKGCQKIGAYVCKNQCIFWVTKIQKEKENTHICETNSFPA